MLTRRVLLGSATSLLMPQLLEAQAPAAGPKVVFQHDVPDILDSSTRCRETPVRRSRQSYWRSCSPKRANRSQQRRAVDQPFAIAPSLSTVFQLRPVPAVPSFFSIMAFVRRERPIPSA
jgi:hypothetical protein